MKSFTLALLVLGSYVSGLGLQRRIQGNFCSEYSCDKFGPKVDSDLANGSADIICSHYYKGNHNWIAVHTSFPGIHYWTRSCNCGAQLDRWYAIPAGYTGRTVHLSDDDIWTCWEGHAAGTADEIIYHGKCSCA